MKSVIYILIFSFTSTILPSKELAKLPFLLEHYKFHKSLDAKISIIDFLELHYTDCKNMFGDENEDMKLPFKSENNCKDFTYFKFIEIAFAKMVTNPAYAFSNFKKHLFHFINSCFTQTAIKLFQPPKL